MADLRAPALRRWAAVLLGTTLLLVLTGPAFAHPLGNFTRNVFVGVVAAPDRVELVVRLDLAELPTLQERQRWDADGDGAFEATEARAFAVATCPEVLGEVALTLDGRRLPPATPAFIGAQLRDGEAGLETLLVTCRGLVAVATPIPGTAELAVASEVEVDRQGWRELVVVGDGVRVAGDAATVSVSDALADYPDDETVLDVRGATVMLTVADAAAGPLPAWATADAAEVEAGDRPETEEGFLAGLTGRYTDLVAARDLTLGFVLFALAASLVLGGLHALAPGHGKTVMAAYVVGQRGTARQALGIAATVAVTHTLGVLALGIVLSAGEAIVPEDLYPWFGAVSGLLLIAVGADLLRKALRFRAAGRGTVSTHTHQHAGVQGHTHDHPHVHEPATRHGHGHHHAHGGHDDGHAQDHGASHDHGPSGHGHGSSRHTHGDAPAAPHTHDHAHTHADGTDLRVAHEHVEDPIPDDTARVGERDGWVVHDHGAGAHAHPVPGTEITPRTLVAMGLAGGLVPSPSALLVLLGAIAIGRTAFGVVLVVTYGLGLAASLVGGGLLLVRFRRGAERFLRERGSGLLGRFTTVVPFVTAVAVLAGGLLVMARALLLD